MFLVTFKTDRKINLIKIIRTLTGMPLVEAKDMVEEGAVIANAEQLGDFLLHVGTAWKRDMLPDVPQPTFIVQPGYVRRAQPQMFRGIVPSETIARPWPN